MAEFVELQPGLTYWLDPDKIVYSVYRRLDLSPRTKLYIHVFGPQSHGNWYCQKANGDIYFPSECRFVLKDE